MSIKSSIRSLTPPLIYEAAHRMRLKRSSGFESPETAERPKPFGYFMRSSFAEAAREAGIGYSDEGLLSKFHGNHAWLTEMADFVAPFLSGVALASLNSKRQGIRVLDFGGASGYFRAYVNDFFNGKIVTHWKIVETAEQVEHNKDLNLSGVEFSTCIGDDQYDLALFSGSLQYIADWKAPLENLNADLILISRTPIADIERPFLQKTMREGMAFSYPGRIISKPALFEVLEKTHELFASWRSEVHLLQLGIHQAPAMIWKRKAD